MKYSVLMPCYMRSGLLLNTLVSFLHHYGARNDFEVIVISDPKDSDEERKALSSLPPFVKVVTSPSRSSNPAQAFNFGATLSSGEFLILTNPECFHQTDVLAGLDTRFFQNRSQYIVCACLYINGYPTGIHNFGEFTYSSLGWYQHSDHNNRLLHFCSALPKDLFSKIGGFDEEYKDGICYEDADFREKVLAAGIPAIPADDLIVLHMDHSRAYVDMPLVEINKQIYFRKWKKLC